MAFSFFSMKQFKSAKSCCKNVQEQAIKYKVVDQELEQATVEIWNGSCKELGQENNEEDDGFETVSEDEEEPDAEMEQ